MMIISVFIFVFCLLAVFSKHFDDGIITKHFLTFSAITAMIVIRDPSNNNAFFVSVGLLVSAGVYWVIKHRHVLQRRVKISR